MTSGDPNRPQRNAQLLDPFQQIGEPVADGDGTGRYSRRGHGPTTSESRRVEERLMPVDVITEVVIDRPRERVWRG
jgi:hypothetical protein